MNKTKTIYFLSALVLIFGCYALNLSYSLFVQTEEKNIVDSSVPTLQATLSVSSMILEPGKEYLLKETIINNGSSGINYGIKATSTSSNYKINIAKMDNNLSYGVLDSNSSKDVYLVVINNDENNAITVNFTLDYNYSTINYDTSLYLTTSNIDNTNKHIVMGTPGIPYSTNQTSLAYKIIKQYVDSELYTDESNFSQTEVSDITTVFTNGESYLSLPVISETIDLNIPTPDFSVGESEEVGLFKSADANNSISYYFRGASSVNYVNFAGMCWRVVRINGDGSIKLLMQDSNQLCSDSIDNSPISSPTFGHTFQYPVNSSGDTSTDLFGYANYLTSNLAIDFKSFQNNSLSTYLDYLTPGNWCSDTTLYRSETSGYTQIFGNDIKNEYYARGRLFFGAYIRKMNNQPTFICSVPVLNKYNDNTDMYVATLTADEIVFGSNFLQFGSSWYWWTMSPYKLDNSPEAPGGCQGYETFARTADLNNIFVSSGDYSTSFNLYPAINLKNGILYNTGDGTINSPYTVKLS